MTKTILYKILVLLNRMNYAYRFYANLLLIYVKLMHSIPLIFLKFTCPFCRLIDYVSYMIISPTTIRLLLMIFYIAAFSYSGNNYWVDLPNLNF